VDLSKLANPPTRVQKGRSILDDWVDSLPATEQVAVLGAVKSPSWGHVALLNVLTEEGAPKVADTTFRAWRVKQGLPA
jgi:hypothetical protein